MRFVTTEKFEKAYSRLSNQHAAAVDKAIAILLENVRYPSLRVKQVMGTKNIMEASATKSLRITFKFVSQDVIQLRNVGTHEQVFRPPY